MKNLFYLFAIIISTSQFTSCKDKCQDSDCLNGGFCDKGKCLCTDGYDGEHCELEIRTTVLGSYTGRYVYNDSITNYAVLNIQRHPNTTESAAMVRTHFTDDGLDFYYNDCRANRDSTFFAIYTADGKFVNIQGRVTTDSVRMQVQQVNTSVRPDTVFISFEGVRI